MAKARALPDLTTRFKVDYTELTKAEKASAKLHGEFQKGAAKSTTHSLRFSQSLTTMMGHFAKLPPVVDTAARSLESMSSQGVSGMTMLGGAAIAGVGVVAAVLGESIHKYQELGDQVENFKRVSGASAEQSGRLVQTFISLGVSEETASNGMFKLSKAIDTTPKKLAALGIEVVRSKDGNVDLEQTLFKVADAYNGTADAAMRNTILQTAFGKSGRDMIPILEQGSVALRRLGESARVTFSDADLEQLKALTIKQNEVKQGWDAMWEAIGQKLIPAEDQLTTSILRGEFVQRRLNDAVAKGTISYDDAFGATSMNNEATNKLIDSYGKEYDQLASTKHQMDLQTKAIADQAKVTADLLKVNDDLINSEDKLYKITVTIAGQRDKVTSATWDVRDAEKTLADDRKKYGPHSEQAIRDAIALRSAQQALTDTIRSGGQDRRQQVIDQEAATGAVRDTNAENSAEIGYYKEMLKHVGKGSPLYKKLQEWIALLQSVPANVGTDIAADFHGSFGPAGTKTKAFGVGGRPDPGIPAWVGEYGKELWVPDRPGTVIPHGQTPQPTPAMAAVGGDTFNFHQVQTDPWQTAAEISWVKKTRRL